MFIEHSEQSYEPWTLGEPVVVYTAEGWDLRVLGVGPWGFFYEGPPKP